MATNSLSSSQKLAVLDKVLAGLMRRYKERVPDVSHIIQHMVKEGIISSGDDIENDHIAFRTMGVPHLGIQSLEKIFLFYGYERRDSYNFSKKKLTAYWYHPPRPDLPRIFISELRVHELSEQAQKIIYSYTNEVTSDPVDQLDLTNWEETDDFLHRPLWHLPTWTDYSFLAQESEYASWVIYNRYYLNHFTITIHNLPEGYNTIEDFNRFLESIGVKLNDSNGKIKTSGDGLLIQSSTVAQLIDGEFDNGKGGKESHRISGSYVEFAERRVLPKFAHLPEDRIGRSERKDGFDEGNADGIFESTYSKQTQKRSS